MRETLDGKMKSWLLAILLAGITVSLCAPLNSKEPAEACLSADPYWASIMGDDCPTGTSPVSLLGFANCFDRLCLKVLALSENREVVLIRSSTQQSTVTTINLPIAMRENLTLCVRQNPTDRTTHLVIGTVRNLENGEKP